RRSLMIRSAPLTAMLALCALAACASGTAAPPPEGPVTTRDAAPAGAPPGTCWARHVSPATIETVTEQVRVPDAGGTAQGARYRTVTHQRIVEERREIRFETPCPDAL